MRLRLDFGTTGARKEVSWWQSLENFPTAIMYNGTRYEWFMYGDDPNKVYDKILVFTEMKSGDSRWWGCRDFDDQFGYSGRTGCECGSQYSSAPQFHMFYCPMWRKV